VAAADGVWVTTIEQIEEALSNMAERFLPKENVSR